MEEINGYTDTQVRCAECIYSTERRGCCYCTYHQMFCSSDETCENATNTIEEELDGKNL